MEHKLPELPYSKDALAPHISAETLEYHYGKHHQTYITKSPVQNLKISHWKTLSPNPPAVFSTMPRRYGTTPSIGTASAPMAEVSRQARLPMRSTKPLDHSMNSRKASARQRSPHLAPGGDGWLKMLMDPLRWSAPAMRAHH